MTDPIYRMALISWNHLHVIFICFHKKKKMCILDLNHWQNYYFYTYLKEAFLQHHKEETVRSRDFHASLFPPIKKNVPLIKEKK